MEARNEAEKRLLSAMDAKGFPASVKTTVIWATRKAADSAVATKEVEELLAEGATTKEMTRAVQKYLAPVKRDMRIDGEYDRPLPERIENPTKEDKEKLQQLMNKYTNK